MPSHLIVVGSLVDRELVESTLSSQSWKHLGIPVCGQQPLLTSNHCRSIISCTVWIESELTGIAQVCELSSGKLSNIPSSLAPKSTHPSTQCRGLPPQSGKIQRCDANSVSRVSVAHLIEDKCCIHRFCAYMDSQLL